MLVSAADQKLFLAITLRMSQNEVASSVKAKKKSKK